MGQFSFTIDTGELCRGLRHSKRSPRNAKFLIECDGAVGRDGVLSALDAYNRINVGATIKDAFPFPQIFMLTNFTLVCSSTKIYEWDNTLGTLTLKYTATKAGGVWSVADFWNYLYISNGVDAVIRNNSGTYAASATQPSAVSICNYNGQVIIAAPDVHNLGASLMMPAGAFSTTLTILGTGSFT